MVMLHGHPVPERVAPPPATWTVNGKAVEMEWDSFEATAPGGYGQLRNARVLPNRGRRVRMWQGDKVEARRPNGRICYQGKLSAPPKYTVPDNVGIITAMGPRTVVDGFNERLPYQIRDASTWVDYGSDPGNSISSEKYTLVSRGNSLGVGLDAVSYGTGEGGGYYLFVDGWPIQRIAFTIRKTAAINNFWVRIRGSNQLGGLTSVQTYVLTDAANPDGTFRDLAISPGYDTIALDVDCWNGPSTPTNKTRVWFEGTRIGVITDQDTFSAADVAADVANRCGYSSQTSGSLNVLPLDWNGPATELLDYVAGLEDATWLVMHSGKSNVYGKLYFRPWGNEVWHVHLSDGSAEDGGLEILPLYDAVRTTYESPPGMPQSKRSKATDFDIKDPLPGVQADYPDPIQLQDPQPNSSLALAVNQRALQRLTQMRLQGSVTVRKTHIKQPFDILPGDKLDIGDFQPRGVPPQRIAGVTYNRDGSVTCSLTRDLNLDSIVSRLANRRIKRHHRHRK
jgi:hypothetical protein